MSKDRDLSWDRAPRRDLSWDRASDRDLTWERRSDKQDRTKQIFDDVTGTQGYKLDPGEEEFGDSNIAMKGLNFIVDGLDYAGNVSRGMIHAAIKGRSVEKAFDDALVYQDRTTAAHIRKAISERYGVQLRLGEDDAKFQWGDVGDFAMDFFIDVATDPLTYLTFGASGVVKSLGAKAVKEATKATAKEAAKEVVSKVALAQRTGRQHIDELTGKAGDVVRQAELEKAIKQQEKLQKVDIKKLQRLPTRKKIKKGIELGVIDEMDMFNRTRQASKQIGRNATVAKELFASGMGGLYTAGAMIDDDTTAGDFARNFALGAASTAGVRGLGKFAADKGAFSAIGNALDRAASMGNKAMMIVNPGTARSTAIATKADAGQMSRIASDAGQSKRHAYMGIRNAFKQAIEQMKQGNAIAAADSLLAIEHFRDMNVKVREEIWQKELKNLTPEQLEEYGLMHTMPKTGKRTKTWSEAGGARVNPLKEKVQAEANATLVNTDGTMKEEVFMKWVRDNEIANGKTVLRNMNVWQEASKEAFKIEKKFIRENLLKVKEKGGIFDETDIVKLRQEAMKDARTAEEIGEFDFADLLEYDDIKTAMDLRLDNQGLAVWSPRRAQVGMATTVTERGKKIPLTPSSRQKAAKDLRSVSNRAVLSRKEMAQYINNGRKLEDANSFINKFEAAANISAENKSRGVLNTIQREAGQYMGDIAKNQSILAGNLRKFNSLVKRGLLLGSYTWIKNNLWSNARQAFVKHGVFAGVGAADPTRYWRTKLGKDIREIFSKGAEKDPPWKYSSSETEDMINRGIIEPSVFQRDLRSSLTDEDLKFMYTEDQLKAIAEKGSGPTAKLLQALDTSGDWVSKGLGTKQWGARVEAMARGATYQRTVKMLKGQDRYRTLVDSFGKNVADEAIKRQATDITNDVFFDYGKLRYWESSFVRELIPFYSFYKQNTLYQTRALLDPEAVPRLAAMARLQDGRYFGGEPITQTIKDSLPQWVKRQNAYTYEKDGKTYIRYTTSDPAGQMWSMLQSEDWGKELAGYLNPAFRSLMFEQPLGYDVFQGGPLLPKDMSSNPDKQIKHLYSQGYMPMDIFNVIGDVIGKNPEIIWTKNGNPVTDSEGVARIQNIMSWAAAAYVNQASQLWAQTRKVMEGKTDILGALTNLFGPISETQLIRSQAKINLERAKEQRVQEKLEPLFEARRRAKGDR